MDRIVEEWRPVAGYEGFYEVSSLGRVRSLERIVMRSDGRTCRVAARFMRFRKKPWGHLIVTLCRNARYRTFYVHQLVAIAFLGPIPEGLQVRHGPQGVADNSVSNLSYGTPKENQADRKRDGTRLEGSQCSWAKISEADVLQIKQGVAAGISQRHFARLYGISPALICRIVSGHVWKHVI